MPRGAVAIVAVVAGALAGTLAACAASPPGPAGTAGAAAAPGAEAVLIEGAKWRLYGCDRLPGAAGFSAGSGPGADAARFTRLALDGLLSFDSQEPANKATWVLAPAVENGSARAFTFVVRLKANDPSERAFDFDFRLGDPKAGAHGPRAKLVVKADEIQIEKPAGQTASTVKYRLDASQFHVYQLDLVVMPKQVVAAVFVDGNDVPVMTAEVTQSAAENRFAFGDMGSNTCKGTIDWMAWTDAAALKPSALKGWLPSSLGDMGWY